MVYKDWLVKIGLALAAVFAPAQAMIGTTFVLVLVDLVTGVLAARKRGEPLTSAGLRRSIVKMFVYEGALVLAFLCQQYLTGPAIPVASLVAGLVGLTELVSCLENLNAIGEGQLLKSVLDKLNSINK